MLYLHQGMLCLHQGMIIPSPRDAMPSPRDAIPSPRDAIPSPRDAIPSPRDDYTFTKFRQHHDGIRSRKKKLRNSSFQNCPPFGVYPHFLESCRKILPLFFNVRYMMYKLWVLPKQCWDHFHKMGWTSKVSKPPTSTHLKFDIGPEKLLSQKESNLPTIIFQGRAVKLRGCILLKFCLGKKKSAFEKFLQVSAWIPKSLKRFSTFSTLVFELHRAFVLFFKLSLLLMAEIQQEIRRSPGGR